MCVYVNDSDSCSSGVFGEACQLEDFAYSDAASEYRMGYVSSWFGGRSEHVHFQVSLLSEIFEFASWRARESVAGLV